MSGVDQESTMRVETLGDGTPEIAVVGGIHGDEPCGVRAVETLLDEKPPVDRPIKCIVANERAFDQGVRYIETDLNRVFPGNPDADVYERRLAAELLEELHGCQVLALHSTQSTDRPFAIASEIGAFATAVCPHLSVDAIVEAGACVETALGGYVDAIEVECGYQESEQATENAVQLVREFLTTTGALPPANNQSEHTLPVYQLQRPIPKPPAEAYAVHVSNFERVEVGTAYATSNETPLIAEESFYPVLMSPYGYETQFGYAAELTDYLGATQNSLKEHIETRERQTNCDAGERERLSGRCGAHLGSERTRE